MRRFEREARAVTPHGLATAYAALGEADRAFAQLEEALRHRSLFLTFLDIDPSIDPLRGDPRLAEIAKRVVPL